MSSPLGAGDGAVWAELDAFLHDPVGHLGLLLAGVSIAAGLLLRWVRRVASA